MADGAAGDTNKIDTYLESVLESADRAERLAVEIARQDGFAEEALHRLGMAVRESVVNAVVHGNRYNARKRVHLLVANSEDRLTVTVIDEGKGFDLTSLPDPLSNENLLQQSGRGIFLIRAFVDEFSIRRLTPSGTEVRLIMHR